jgi:uncharacterized membrane protein YagU involved in acid resistance
MENKIPYGLRITFLVHFVFAVVFGLVLLLVPEMYGGMMGAPITPPSVYSAVWAQRCWHLELVHGSPTDSRFGRE